MCIRDRTRCVDPKVVSVFAGKHMIYEDVKYHNVVFVGFDSDGIPVSYTHLAGRIRNRMITRKKKTESPVIHDIPV